jgi:cbb3-type cytochrome oxidase subunit 1
MSALSLRCIRAALLCLASGVGLGVTFAVDRATGAALRPLHVELNLWGWVTLLIYGMAYHMLPRFADRPLRWPQLADAQAWLAIVGVALAATGWIATRLDLPMARLLLVSGGLTQALAALIFALIISDLLRRTKPRPG